MSVLEILMNAGRIALVIEAWQGRINRMGFGRLPAREKINRIFKILEKMATDPAIDDIVDEHYLD